MWQCKKLIPASEFVRWNEYFNREDQDFRTPDQDLLGLIAFEIAMFRYHIDMSWLVDAKNPKMPDIEDYVPRAKYRKTGIKRIEEMTEAEKKELKQKRSEQSLDAWCSVLGLEMLPGGKGVKLSGRE